MAGIYIHIPFCKQACHYCNFHFSTSLFYKNELIASLLKEAELQKDYLDNATIETIYFGGGTPSLLETEEVNTLVKTLKNYFVVSPEAEISLEVNPDDITEKKLEGWKTAGVNRLSVGVQSFFEEDLAWMNRAHNAQQAFDQLQQAGKYFKNITADLIYGHPLLSHEKWEKNIEKMVSLEIPHLSCYALTVEPKTPLHKMIRENKKEDVDAELQSLQFLRLMDILEKKGYEHYEISNFAKPGFRSRHNSSYWQGKKYLGLGPSAHSYNGVSRQWNVSNNNSYIHSIKDNILSFEVEHLSESQKVNEYIMTSLRTAEGLSLKNLSEIDRTYILKQSEKFIASGKLEEKDDGLVLTREGKLFADGIAAALFTGY